MHHFLFLLPLLPLLGFVLLVSLAGKISKPYVALVGAGSVGLAALLSLGIGLSFFLRYPLAGGVFTQHVADWLSIGSFNAGIAFHLDALSLLMALVICCVGFLIHIYSIEYMIGERDYARFFACMNLFVAAMLVLVLSDNFLLLFLGWEGVGFCSWLLIGFWHQDPANVRSANKAFIVTRIGDVALALGIFLVYSQLGTVHIQTALEAAPRFWLHGGEMALLAAALFLVGSLGKSGQLPLQVWLPDAMAGPTPVSALIHAATMVTAGVYLLARMSALFMLSPEVMHATAVIGAATLLVAGLCALAQNDIKRALAYSTISQLGYMYLALGVGAYSAAMFHFMTHAFFKALLFMAAGWIIVGLHHEQDMLRMGGLRRHMPTAFWCFLIGSMSLAAFPFLDSGFYSKELILGEVFTSGWHGQELWLIGCLGAFITALYTGRMMMLVFFGKSHAHLHIQPGRFMRLPLVILAVLATIGGAPELLRIKEGESLLHTWFTGQFHTLHLAAHESDSRIQVIAMAAVLLGLFSAWALYGPMRGLVFTVFRIPPGRWVRSFWAAGAGFDAIYSVLFVLPYTLFARMNRNDLFSALDKSLSGTALASSRILVATQNGNVRWYMAAIALGAVTTIIVAVFL